MVGRAGRRAGPHPVETQHEVSSAFSLIATSQYLRLTLHSNGVRAAPQTPGASSTSDVGPADAAAADTAAITASRSTAMLKRKFKRKILKI